MYEDHEGTLVDEAFRKGQLRVEYQPIYDLRTKRLAAFEALTRSELPDFSHHRVVDAYEDLLFSPVLIEAVHVAATMGLPISVNVSPLRLEADDSLEEIRAGINQAEIEPKNLIVEITERQPLTQVSVQVLRELSEWGVRVSLDDFGEKHAAWHSFQAVAGFAHSVKIDKALIEKIIEDEGTDLGRRIVKSIIKLCHGEGMKVTAEGLEKRSQHEGLAELGCDFVQGFLYSPAVSLGQVPNIPAVLQLENLKAAKV